MELPEILYEDEDVFVFNKPDGLMVHGDGRSTETSLADMLLSRFPEMKEAGEPMRITLGSEEKVIYRPGIVHRLDKDTTGALAVAKNQHAFESLKKQFQERSVEKRYLAIVYGHVKDDRGVIDRPIARSKSDFRRWSATRGARGEPREAVTEFRVIRRFKDERGEPFTLLEVSPKTGRTHQIRVHLQAANYPIVGDSLYAGKREPALGFTRPALHAASLTLDLAQGRTTVKAPLPADFQKALAGLAPLDFV